MIVFLEHDRRTDWLLAWAQEEIYLRQVSARGLREMTANSGNKIANRRIQFQKRSQLFIRSHNETLSFNTDTNRHEWLRDKTSPLTPHVQVQQMR
jgi:hypothetical protein